MEYINPTTTAHHSTVELANTKLLLRSDLSFHLQEYQGQPCYLIEDELHSKYYRVGPAEYNFLSLLDGGTTISQAVAQTASSMGQLAIKHSDAISICKWLINTNLASTSISRSSNRLIESLEESSRRQTIQKLNPITPKIPLFNPDWLLTILNSAMGWLFSLPLFFVWLLVVGCGLYYVYADWSLATTHASAIFSRDNWIWLGLAWIMLKLIHETAHGIVCKRFGGDIRQAGVVLIVLIPLPYVDVTSSWRFSSKWQRIYVAAAGMYAELFVAAIAAIVWSHCEPGMFRQQCYNIMIAGSVTTLFFNANPLMRFDGYYMLTDWLELPNLATHATQFLRWFGKKYYLGLETIKPTWPEKEGTWSVPMRCRVRLAVTYLRSADSHCRIAPVWSGNHLGGISHRHVGLLANPQTAEICVHRKRDRTTTQRDSICTVNVKPYRGSLGNLDLHAVAGPHRGASHCRLCHHC